MTDMLRKRMTAKMIAIHAATGTVVVQYCKTMAPAVASAATRMAYAYLEYISGFNGRE
jgi:hypothetical protein